MFEKPIFKQKALKTVTKTDRPTSSIGRSRPVCSYLLPVCKKEALPGQFVNRQTEALNKMFQEIVQLFHVGGHRVQRRAQRGLCLAEITVAG